MSVTTSTIVPVVAPKFGMVMGLVPVTCTAFSRGLLGSGCGVIPQPDQMVAPMAGQVMHFAKTKRALAFQTQNGLALWLRLGLDSPTWTERCFKLVVKVGDHVQAGQVIAVVDRCPQRVVHRWTSVILMNPVVQAAMRALRWQPRNLIDPAGTVSTKITLDLAANHEVATIGPPDRTMVVEA
ncbi:PTS glucose transporter subunit IIA [Lactiplantibacillus mudanjiangensis]|uniref:PTS, EIIA [Lactobacillus plantarum subsp. plantarum ST-III] n=1 Tax=Lactiplantibacillus mudanjiangensis TaxID=1296538 RepID=A0A660E693_9LACO|nr:PTS glucose transporter subunit IIA [Lactiplantibacillus mudanjiangensis]VDG20146.1 PTS, EIIA [Lactobacillus plantarum subsp. plantarum ST-III] [Lactiplantibacillus mudanjiangensis]VDG23843.1 PTS, EIIA [Lactobacillus plantarum subsp. plantarum ST-III] [Lactiplantibacillus mudanjiangensis]VDG30339.1 PTS, EIIA [Lactobacillus plantarum subsp. plantarum ST-III] [Lactiplantibacillus mudanjiangensis]VDG33541.1 PTS, EIIA [Lactobacillus plantarum subsp. plantarum ST-III] [Lactiplantibacillus mudanji